MLVSEDDYYRDLSHLSPADRAAVNFDHPAALDLEALAADLAVLRLGLGADVPEYDFSTHTRRARRRRIEPTGLIVVEGALLLHAADVRAQLDLSIYVDAPLDLCLLRRVRRDTEERGRSVASVLAQYEATVRPMALAYVLPQRDLADRILSGEGPLIAAAVALAAEVLPRA